MDEVSEDWGVEVERGPDWVFVRLRPGTQEPVDVADRVWKLADRHFVYRLVLEMDQLDAIPSRLLGQLVTLQKRVLQRRGALRLCGLSEQCAEAIHFCRLDQALPNYSSREDAVLGQRDGRLVHAH
ncbi:MAG TPA: STAS domain-containing protein [Lacipirellulaceae bacterium]|nr:STAS domain-containing protein [Lacipirellulaceae bacterium]